MLLAMGILTGGWCIESVRGATNTYIFSYTNRTALLADGWSFLATSPGGGTRDTENTNSANGGVVSYDQTAHPGTLQIPCDAGDLYNSLNNSRNSLFRGLSSNWLSLRLAFSFAPTTNYQQTYLGVYQDDDNYVEAGIIYNEGQLVSMYREMNQFPITVATASSAATNLYLRLDQDLGTAKVTGYYSTDNTNWVTLGTIPQAFANPEVCIWTGGAATQWTNGMPVLSLQSLSVITSNTYVAPAPVLVVQPQRLVFNATAGVADTNRQALHLVLSSSLNPSVTWSLTNDASWCVLSATNGTTPGSCDVSVNTTGLTSGVYTATLNAGVTGATSVVAHVTLIVNPNGRAKAAKWRGGSSGAMSVWVDDSYPTAFDDLSTNGFAGTYVMWHLGAPAYFTTYYNAGMELGSHTVDHPCYLVNTATLQYEFETNIASLVATAPEPQSQVISFAWPCGANDYGEEAQAANYFLVARGYNINQLENASPYDFMNLKSFNSHEHFPYPPADLKTCVDAAITNGQWFVMVLHSTNNDNGAIVYAVGKDLWMAPGGTVTKYIMQRDRTVVTNYQESAGRYLVWVLPFAD